MKTKRYFLIVSFAGVVFLVFGVDSLAGTHMDRDRQYVRDDDWSVRFGAAVLYKPDYEGSDDYDLKVYPVIDIMWRDTFFLNPRRGLGAYLLDRNDVKVGVSIGYSFGRDEDDSGDLDGLGDIDGGATANVLFERDIAGVSFDARYEHQVTGEETGFQVHLGLGYKVRLGEKAMLSPSVRATYASSHYMEKYFSISQGQSARSGLSAYDADPGIKSAGLGIISIHRLGRHWGVQTFAGYERYVGDAADSPVVKDENRYLAGVGLSYSF